MTSLACLGGVHDLEGDLCGRGAGLQPQSHGPGDADGQGAASRGGLAGRPSCASCGGADFTAASTVGTFVWRTRDGREGVVVQLGEHSLLAPDAPQRGRQARHTLPGRGPSAPDGVTHCAHTTPSKNMQADVRVRVEAGGKMTPPSVPAAGRTTSSAHHPSPPRPDRGPPLPPAAAARGGARAPPEVSGRQRSCPHAHVIPTRPFGEDENVPRAA